MGSNSKRNFSLLVAGILIGIIGGLLIGCTLGTVARYRLTPPLQSEYENLEKELYAYYIVHKKIPTDDSFMSPASQKLLKDHPNEITWDPETQTVAYNYDKPYPTNLSFLSIISGGLIIPECNCLGISTGPGSIPNNANLYHQKGQLKKQIREAERRQ